MAADATEAELSVRRQVYLHVLAHPGLHLSEIMRSLPVSASTVRYHLDQLERQGVLTRTEGDGYVRYYARVPGAATPHDVLSRDEKVLVALLRQAKPRRIALHLLHEGDCAQGDIARALDVPASSLAHHLKKLTNAGVVVSAREGRETRYGLRDPARVADVLYRIDAPLDLADAFTDLVDRLGL